MGTNRDRSQICGTASEIRGRNQSHWPGPAALHTGGCRNSRYRRQAQAIREMLCRCPEFWGHLDQHHALNTECLTSSCCFLTFPSCKTEGMTHKHLGKRLWSRGLTGITGAENALGESNPQQPLIAPHQGWQCIGATHLPTGWFPSQTPKPWQIIVVTISDFQEALTFKALFQHSVKKNPSLLKLKNKPFLCLLFAN